MHSHKAASLSLFRLTVSSDQSFVLWLETSLLAVKIKSSGKRHRMAGRRRERADEGGQANKSSDRGTLQGGAGVAGRVSQPHMGRE
jgi:hypothetical protein